MIVQTTPPVMFEGVSQLRVLLSAPSAGNTHLVAAFMLRGTKLPAIASVVDSLSSRWRLANDAQLSVDRRVVYFVRPLSPRGVLELTATTANNIAVSGYGMALEGTGHQGEVVQALADLVQPPGSA